MNSMNGIVREPWWQLKLGIGRLHIDYYYYYFFLNNFPRLSHVFNTRLVMLHGCAHYFVFCWAWVLLTFDTCVG